MIKETILATITLFIAVDGVGTLPIFISLTGNFSKKERDKILINSLIIAFWVAFIFIFIGKGLFKIIGITMQDFMISGGILLFAISLMEIFKINKYEKKYYDDVGAVPLGTPLITGPAVLTTILLIIDQYGIIPTIISLIINILFTGFIFYFSNYFTKLIGKNGTNAISKIMALLLAAIAVMLVRKGIIGFFK